MAKLGKKEALALLEARREIDPLRRFLSDLCTPRQREIMQSNTLYVLVTTANQGGKTTGAVAECAALLRGIHPYKPWFGPVSILVMVPSRAQAAGIWGKRLLQASDLRRTVTTGAGETVDLSKLPFIPASEIALNVRGQPQIVWAYSPQGKYPGYVKFKNGSELRIGLSGDPKSWQRVQGFPYDAIFRDEAVGNEDLNDELLARLLVAQTAVREGSRPWGGLIRWVATETLVSPEFTAFRKRCDANEPDHATFWMDPNENPAVSAAVRNSMRTAMSSEAAAIRLDGLQGATDNILIYRGQWNSHRHILAEDYEPGPLDNLWISFDPGWDHPYGILCCCISPEAPMQIKVVRFYNATHQTLDQCVTRMQEWLDGRILEGLICDPATKRTDYNRGESYAVQLENTLEKCRIRIVRGLQFGRNVYEDTIPLVQRYLDPDPGNPSAVPMLVVNPTSPGCGAFVDQMMSYRKKVGSMDAKRHYSVYAKNNEGPDTVRYLISRQPGWCTREPNIARTQYLRPTVYPPVPPGKPDPYEITADMSDDIKLHRIRLGLSARTADRLATGGSWRMMHTGSLPF